MAVQRTIPREFRALRTEVADALRNVEPSISEDGCTLYPCEATTDDGVVHPRVFLVAASSYIQSWGVSPR